MTQAQHQFSRAPEAHPVLPGKLVRDDVMKTLRRLRRVLGISSARLDVIDAMIRQTDATAWTSPGAAPICYRRQLMIAEETGYCTRMIHECETYFEQIGFLIKDVAADGSRGRFAGGLVTHGLCFSPLIERMPELIELDAERLAAIARRDGLRRQCSSARRMLSRTALRLVELAPTAPETAEATAALAEFPARYSDFAEDALEALVEKTRLAVSKALEFLDLQMNRSGLSEPGFRPHIHDKRHEKSEDCNGSTVDKQPARKRAEPDLSGFGPDGPAHCNENKCATATESHKPTPTESFTPRQIYGMASDAFRLYLDALRGDRAITELDLILAAERMLIELQINPRIWDRAVEQMGELRTALSVLVIDARQSDPVRPIRSPGASLQSFIALDRAGRLNLAGSMIGLLHRGK